MELRHVTSEELKDILRDILGEELAKLKEEIMSAFDAPLARLQAAANVITLEVNDLKALTDPTQTINAIEAVSAQLEAAAPQPEPAPAQ